ncbi:MAG: thioesterase family protein [Planctomycetota bacterium]|nr:thioesterase family protein [Planctomycetota bacterium]
MNAIKSEHEIEIRVHYHEVDGQGRVHNAQYLNYFERGRVEMLRASGLSYLEFELSGILLVVRSIEVQFLMPALFDDNLVLTTRIGYCHGARIEHHYRLVRKHTDSVGEDVIVTATSQIASIDRTGKVQRLPPILQLNIRPSRNP